jgi:hypothetical protein
LCVWTNIIARHYSYTQRKTGRNVTHLNFKIDAKEAAPKAVKRPSLTQAYVEKHALPGESWEGVRDDLGFTGDGWRMA